MAEWTVGERQRWLGGTAYTSYLLRNQDGKLVAEVRSEKAEEDTRRIVAAVNHADALAERLSRAERALHAEYCGIAMTDFWHCEEPGCTKGQELLRAYDAAKAKASD